MYFREFCIACEERCVFSENPSSQPVRFLLVVQNRLSPSWQGLLGKGVALVTLLCNRLVWCRKDYFLKISYIVNAVLIQSV